MIWFIAKHDRSTIKIGFTDNFPIRHKALEAHYSKPLALLATMEGNREQEAEIHARFAHLRLGRSEQLKPGPDLMAFIDRPLLVSANSDAVEMMVTPKGVQLDCILASRAKFIASDMGIDTAKYLADLLRSPIERDWAKIRDRMDDAGK